MFLHITWVAVFGALVYECVRLMDGQLPLQHHITVLDFKGSLKAISGMLDIKTLPGRNRVTTKSIGDCRDRNLCRVIIFSGKYRYRIYLFSQRSASLS